MVMMDALKAMADVLGDGSTAGDTATAFTCGEADALARVLVRAGYREAAVTWLSAHAEGDQYDNSHFVDSEDRAMNEREVGAYVDSL